MDVENLLNSRNLEFREKGSDYIVRCLNPEHEDRHPSMRIDKVTGIFNCFSCGHKGNIFTEFDEKPNQLQQQREKLKKLVRKKMSENVGLQFPPSATPYVGNWRDIKPETYRKFEAFLDHNTSEYLGRIVFPIRNIAGKIVAFNGRHTTGGDPKYIFHPRGVKLPLFPNARALAGSIILVEGIFDMLNLHDKGLTNTVCCFGTNNISQSKLAILRMRGVDSIEIFFDGDEAGQTAAEKVAKLCEKAGLHSQNIYMEGTDPGELTINKVQELRKILYG